MAEEPVKPSSSEAEFFERPDGTEEQFKEYAQEVCKLWLLPGHQNHYSHLDPAVVATGYLVTVSEEDVPELQ
ncbi:hypothetical protein ABZP36_010447 [Zizania latifolia]